MTDSLQNIPDTYQAPDPLETVKLENFEGIGEITIGVGSNAHMTFVALSLLNDPQVNKFLLAQKLKLEDRITKTKIFPRKNMALPNGEFYKEIIQEEKKEG